MNAKMEEFELKDSEQQELIKKLIGIKKKRQALLEKESEEFDKTQKFIALESQFNTVKAMVDRDKVSHFNFIYNTTKIYHLLLSFLLL